MEGTVFLFFLFNIVGLNLQNQMQYFFSYSEIRLTSKILTEFGQHFLDCILCMLHVLL